MGIDAIINAKIPAWPKDIDDKNLAAEYKQFQKTYAEIKKFAEDCQAKIGGVSTIFADFSSACDKKLKDKNLDPKQAKAVDELRSATSALATLVGRNVMM